MDALLADPVVLTGARQSVGLSVVIPVYRGAATIAALVAALADLRPEGGLEIILVNDGSPDESGSICRRLLREAPVPILYIEHARNFGEHNAVMSGLRQAAGAYVITMDDDLQNPPGEVVRLYDHARAGGWDVVYTRYAVKHHAAWRNLGSRFANTAADWLIDKPRGLYLSSFRCMSALAVGAVTAYRGPYPYVDGLLLQATRRIDSIEVRHLPRASGASNYNLRRLVRLWLNLATSFSLAPLRLATIAGAAMALVGMIGAVATIIEALTARSEPSGWASTMTVILLVSGVQSMILGVLGEYVGRIFLSANGKPQGVVRMIERSPGERSPGARSLDKHSLDEHSLDEHSLDEHSLDEQSLDEHSLGEHSLGEQSLGEHSLEAHRLAEHSEGPA
jgi:undecaprenyl-phosphate 4-deoxy-4-formamido-L-arabinose transferase